MFFFFFLLLLFNIACVLFSYNNLVVFVFLVSTNLGKVKILTFSKS